MSPSISVECILVVVMNDSQIEGTEYLTISLSTLTEGLTVKLTQEKVNISITDSTGRKLYNNYIHICTYTYMYVHVVYMYKTVHIK